MFTKLKHIFDNLEGIIYKANANSAENDRLIPLTTKYSSEWKKFRKALSLP
jgi:hypothetical protein